MSVLDEAVRRVLRAKFRAGLSRIHTPMPGGRRGDSRAGKPGGGPQDGARVHRADEEREESLTARQGNQTMALIGPLVDDQADQLGSWAGDGQAQDTVYPREGIKTKLPNARILVSRGVDLGLRGLRSYYGATGAAPAPSTATGAADEAAMGPTNITEAVRTAQQADVAILFLASLRITRGKLARARLWIFRAPTEIVGGGRCDRQAGSAGAGKRTSAEYCVGERARGGNSASVVSGLGRRQCDRDLLFRRCRA